MHKHGGPEVLSYEERELRPPGEGEVLIRVAACAVCRTDLHVVDGDLTRPKLPLVPGHEIVGTIVDRGPGASRFTVGARVGVPWLGWTCGLCSYCLAGRENLCDRARFTGYDVDGGYAEMTTADERFCFACFDGNYPEPVPYDVEGRKFILEEALTPARD